jgi:Zn-dependent alcohol dehydrogenase
MARAAVIHAAKDLRIEDRPVREPGPREVEIQVGAGGICGSDLHYYNHGVLAACGFASRWSSGMKSPARLAKSVAM